MITYIIQHTHKGVYIVRDQADRQLARFATEADAAAFIAERQAQNTAAEQAHEADLAEQQTFDDSLIDLKTLQLRWQRWRDWFYDVMMAEAKNTAAHQRAMDRAAYADSPSQRKQEHNLTAAMEEDETARVLYEQAVALDTRIKTTRRQQHVDALADALTETEAIITRMNGFFLYAARPEDWGGARVGSGRKPLADGEPTVRKTVTLPASQAAELETLGDGNLSAGIRKLMADR